jgi:hypothetical protein
VEVHNNSTQHRDETGKQRKKCGAENNQGQGRETRQNRLIEQEKNISGHLKSILQNMAEHLTTLKV